MSDGMWEPWWRYRGVPGVGDYVQVFSRLKGEPHITTEEEGIVTSINGSIISLNGKPNPGFSIWMAEKWRKRIVPLRDEEKLEEEQPIKEKVS